MPKRKREEAGSISNQKRHKLQRLYMQGNAGNGFVRNLVETSKISPKSETIFTFKIFGSDTRFTLATRKFKRLKECARFENENWCMDLVYVVKITKDSKDVKYLLLRQDLSDRTVGAKGMKTKDSKETIGAFLTIITKKNPKKMDRHGNRI